MSGRLSELPAHAVLCMQILIDLARSRRNGGKVLRSQEERAKQEGSLKV